jgi:CheY-like chemotaxis protein
MCYDTDNTRQLFCIFAHDEKSEPDVHQGAACMLSYLSQREKFMRSQNGMHPATRILVVEDDISISRLIGLAMPELNIPYTFSCVQSAEAALKRWETESFDLLLTDYNLPGLRGTDLVQRLRERGHEVPMVIFTAYDSPQLAREVRQLNVAAYIAKPFLMEDLLDTIHSVLETRVRAVNG